MSIVFGLYGCRNPPAPAQPLEPTEPAPAKEPVNEAAVPKSEAEVQRTPARQDAAGYPKEGWSKVVKLDAVPLCVFANEIEFRRAQSIELAKKPQTLRANTGVTFGTYAPGCVHESCDDLPTLQCWTEQEGHRLVVHSRYSAYHKDGAECGRAGQECRIVAASCETPALAAGSYSVQHGSQTFELKIPGSLRAPCAPKKAKGVRTNTVTR